MRELNALTAVQHTSLDELFIEAARGAAYVQHQHHHHLSLNREGRWGTTDDFATGFLHFFPVLHCPQGLAELQACPFPDVVFSPLPLSALSSSPFHCALQDGFGQT